jgi:hypothetical protein
MRDTTAAREALALDVELPPVGALHRIGDETPVRGRMAFEGDRHSWIMAPESFIREQLSRCFFATFDPYADITAPPTCPAE